MRISILGYYHLADGYLSFAEEAKKDHEVSFFPFMSYLHDKLPIVETLRKFLKNELDEKTTYFYENMVIPKNEPDVLLIWITANDVSQIIIDTREFFSGKIYIHNWDPNYTEIEHPHWHSQKEALFNSAKQADCVFTVNPLEVKFYERNGINAKHCYSGFSEKYSYPVEDEEYKCDVSAVITNLYTDGIWDLNKQKINRKELLDQLYEDKSINLKIYGLPNIESHYPDSYVRQIPYKECHKVFSNSKINLCVHAISIDNYLSERAPQIIGSGGLLYTDNEIGLDFIPGEDYVLVNSDPYQQIKDLLQSESEIKRISQNGYSKKSSINWNQLLNLIFAELSK